MLTSNRHVDAVGIHSITSPTLEEAVSALCEKVFGARLVIATTPPADAPATHPAPATPATPITYETENNPNILRTQRDGWQETAEARSRTIENKDATIARLKGELAVTGEVMRDNIDLKAETERLHALWHEAQHNLDLLRDHHKAAREVIQAYEATAKHNAEVMRRERLERANCQSGNRSLADEVARLKARLVAAESDADRYENLWIEMCDQARRERNG